MDKTITLTDDQMNVIKTFRVWLADRDEKYMIISGCAGSGKTTLIGHLYEAMEIQAKMYEVLLSGDRDVPLEILLCASTNKAASVLSQITHMPVNTIHSTLKLTMVPDFKKGGYKAIKRKDYALLRNKLLVIDEVSMMSDGLYDVLDESTIDCKVLMIGDQYQLAPVKQKKSIMEKLKCTKVTMNKVMRHAGAILHTSAQFRNTVETGVFQDIPEHDNVLQVDGPTFQKLIDSAFLDPNLKENKAKVLAWSNARVDEYNQHIRRVKGFPKDFQIGERVITNNTIICTKGMWQVDSRVHITNISESTINRGVAGWYVEIDEKFTSFLPCRQADKQQLLKNLKAKAINKTGSWSDFYGIKEGWLDLRPTYASTVHKSQGSSYDTVFIDLSDIGRCNIGSDVARMLYVSISRAVNQVVLYGSLPPRYRGAVAA